jgi:hypothetical protein
MNDEERVRMPSATYTIDVGSTSSTALRRTPPGDLWASNLPARASRRIAPLSSIGQAYYWKHSWQAGERESLAELAAGKGRVFDDPGEAIRYLLSTDEK